MLKTGTSNLGVEMWTAFRIVELEDIESMEFREIKVWLLNI